MIKKLRNKWLLYSIGSLLLIGFGISLIGEAIILKSSAENSLSWIGIGTVALIVFNSGICIFGQAVILRMKLDLFRNEKTMRNENY